jgi:hypothetical protein
MIAEPSIEEIDDLLALSWSRFHLEMRDVWRHLEKLPLVPFTKYNIVIPLGL